jgi:hypothetical protein
MTKRRSFSDKFKATVALKALRGDKIAQTSTDQTLSVPVMLYPDSDHGPCNIGLQVNSGGAVIRSGPGDHFPIVATLKEGHVVSGCDGHHGWEGNVDGQDGACTSGDLISEERAYSGGCTSGWIEGSSLTPIYG